MICRIALNGVIVSPLIFMHQDFIRKATSHGYDICATMSIRSSYPVALAQRQIA
jgi:hypothetical protein